MNTVQNTIQNTQYFTYNEEEKILNNGTDAQKISLCVSKYNEGMSSEERQMLEDTVRKGDKLYNNIIDTNYPYESKVFVPECYSIVEAIVPRLMGALFSQKPFFKCKAREKDDIDSAEITEQYLDWQLDNSKFLIHIDEVLRSAVKYGSGMIKIYWNRAKEKLLYYAYNANQNGDIIAYSEQVKQILISELKFEYVNLLHIIKDPAATKIEDCDYFIHRMYKSIDYLKKVYTNWSELVNNIAADINADSGTTDNSENQSATPQIERQRKNNRVEILECWIRNKRFVIGDQRVLLKNRKFNLLDKVQYENPYWHKSPPFAKFDFLPQEGKFYGKSAIVPIEPLQQTLNNIRNQRMDNVNLIINTIYGISGNVNESDFRLAQQSGGVFRLKDATKDVLPLRPPDVTQNAYQEEQAIKQDIQRTTGITDYSRGAAQGSTLNRTATGISLIQNAADVRLNYNILMLQQTGLIPLLQKVLKLNKQFITKKEYLRVVGRKAEAMDEIIEVNPQIFSYDYDIEVMTASAFGNPQIRQQNAQLLYQLLGGNPAVNQEELLKDLVKSFDKNPIILLNDPLENEKQARYENDLMENDYPINAPKYNEDHIIHLKIHSELSDSQESPHVREHYRIYKMFQDKAAQLQQMSGSTGGQVQGESNLKGQMGKTALAETQGATPEATALNAGGAI